MSDRDSPDPIGGAFSTGSVDADENLDQFYRQAYWLALCSLHVYPPEHDPKESDADAEKRIKGLFPGWGLDWDRFEYISNASTQCFVAGNADVIVVCYRGTEMSGWDFLQDLVAIQVGDAGIEGRAHLGFLNGLAEAWDHRGGLAEGQGLVAALKRHRTDQKVWFTGHSLGGAIAVLAAARLICEKKILFPADVAGIITFGQPRVGNDVFASAYDDKYGLKNRHVRFVNNMDGVTLSPLPFRVLKFPSYRHVGRVAFIDRAEKIWPYAGFGRMLRGRCMSWFRGLSRGPRSHEKSVGLINRVLPLGSDHSMLGYAGALAKKVKEL